MLLYEKLKKKKKRHMAILLPNYSTQKLLQTAPEDYPQGTNRDPSTRTRTTLLLATWYTIKDSPSVQNRAAFIRLSFVIH